MKDSIGCRRRQRRTIQYLLWNDLPIEALNYMERQYAEIDADEIELFESLMIATLKRRCRNHHDYFYAAIAYTLKVREKRWLDLEEFILLSAQSGSYMPQIIDYTKTYVGRWKKLERAIIDKPYTAYVYAKDVLRGRWIQAEAYIASEHNVACLYAIDVIQHRWHRCEQAGSPRSVNYREYCRHFNIYYEEDTIHLISKKFPKAKVNWHKEGF